MNSIYPIEKKDDKDLNRILSLYEIIKRYELLVEFLLDNTSTAEPLDGRGLKKAIKDAAMKLEKEYVLNTLIETNFNRLKAAKILKVSYKTLLRAITDHKLEVKGSHKKKEKPEYVGV